MTSATMRVGRATGRIRIRPWVVGSALSEGIGMTAASAAAVVGRGLGDEAPGLALALVVLGGLVEGTALGVIQARLLRDVLAHRRVAWVLTTVAVAGLGWAATSAPQTLGGDSGPPPPLGLVLAGDAGLGLVMGAALGGAQALTLRGLVDHPWRWASVSALAWVPAMTVIFAGATTPSSQWHALPTVLLGLVTGVAAGAALGLVSATLLRTLDGPPLHALMVMALLRTRLGHRLARSLIGLQVVGARTGRTYELLVQYAVAPAPDGDELVVVPLRHERKTWWRNLRAEAPVEVLHAGRWHPAYGRVVRAADHDHAALVASYTHRWPRMKVPDDQPVVVLRLRDTVGI